MKRLFILLLVLAVAIAKTFAFDCDIEYTIKETRESASYTSFIVEYKSANADMTGTQTVSGVITIPSTGKAIVLLLDNHHTITSDEEAPSVSGSSAAGQLLSGAYCIAATDYIGYGSTKDQVHPYLCARQNAKNSIDLAEVAWKIIEERGVEFDHKKMVNIGYSQGGGVAMAVHREMEQNEELARKLHFAGSWCGDGPYDVKATVEEYFANRDNVAYPAGLPLLVNGFLSGASAELRGNLKFSDFIAPKLVEAGLEEWIASKEYDTTEINEMMMETVGSETLTIDDIFSSEMAELDGTLTKKYFEFAESDCLCQGWTPKLFPIRLIHLVNDKVVPILNAENAVEGLQLTEDQYSFIDERYYDHASFSMYFYLNLVYELNNFNYNDDPTHNSLISTQDYYITRQPVKRLDGRSIIIEHNGQKYDITGKTKQ